MNLFARVLVSSWPLIKLKCVLQDLGFEEFCKVGTFLDDTYEVVFKKMGVDKRVLVFDDVSDDHVDGSDLVVIDTNIKSRFTITLLEKHRKVVREIFIISFI